MAVVNPGLYISVNAVFTSDDEKWNHFQVGSSQSSLILSTYLERCSGIGKDVPGYWTLGE